MTETVGVVGLGRFGGGLGLTRRLLESGSRVRLFDRLSADDLAGPLQELSGHADRLTFHSGDHVVADFDGCSTVYLNPAVDWHGPLATALRERGHRLSSDLELWASGWPGRILGITGSNGKSTCWEILRRLLPDWSAGGNIGVSVFDLDPSVPGAVLELSSFQLERFAPVCSTAVITTFSPDHLDRHGTLDDYAAAKRRLLEMQPATGRAVLGMGLGDWPVKGSRTRLGVDVGVEDGEIVFDDGWRVTLRGFPLPGPHNAELAALALAAARHEGVEDGELARRFSVLAREGLQPLPHRQNILHREPTFVVDDSKATTPESTLCALETFAVPGRTHVIVGGAEKDLDITALARRCREWSLRVYAIGEQAVRWREHPGAVDCGTLDEAVKTIAKIAADGEIILLSPGTSSLDQFRDYRERGETFRKLVAEHLK